MADTNDLHNQELATVLEDTDRIAAGKPGQSKAKNITWGNLFALINSLLSSSKWFTNNQTAKTDSDVDLLADDARGLKYEGTQGLSRINAASASDGDIIWIRVVGAGRTIKHNEAASGTFKPIWLQAEESYTTTGEKETFSLRYWADIEQWVEVNAQSVSGGVVPDVFVAEKAQQRAEEVQDGTEIVAFPNNSLVGFSITGELNDLTAVANARENVIVFSGTGVGIVSEVTLASGETYTFPEGKGRGYAKNEETGIVYVLGGTGNEVYTNNASYRIHENGAVITELGELVPNNDDKTTKIQL